MGEETEIAWCDATFNIVWGCTKVSEACKFCYAESFAKRVGLKVWGQDADRRILSESYWKAPFAWNAKAARDGVRRRVFCSSMADVFEDHPIVESQRARLWPLIAATPALDWLLLTKRPENMPRMAPLEWASRWPSNIWVGTTVENQARADERIPHLLQVPARIRFLSCEPMLEAIDLAPYLVIPDGLDDDPHAAFLMHEAIREGRGDAQRKLSWVISGGESGPGARPFNLAWARSIRDQCKAAGVPYFFKQAGSRPVDGDNPVRLRDRKGGDISEVASDLNIREWPHAS